MKTITVNVSEPVYRDFQDRARHMDRAAAELIRDAMEEYRQRHLTRTTSLRDRRPVSVGGVVEPIDADTDLLAEILSADEDDSRD